MDHSTSDAAPVPPVLDATPSGGGGWSVPATREEPGRGADGSAGAVVPRGAAGAGFRVRAGEGRDLPFIDALQKAHSREVGFLPTRALEGKVRLGQVLVAEAGGRPAGYLIAADRYQKRDEVGYVTQVNVVPEHRRSLVAGAMLQAQFDRSAYGCRLYCCWCAQDLAANEFWEAMGFAAIAFRTGSRTKGKGPDGKAAPRIHLFWQKRVRAGDVSTPWWYPSVTGGGVIREDRVVFPVPPGVGWRDVLPVVLPEGLATPALPGALPGAEAGAEAGGVVARAKRAAVRRGRRCGSRSGCGGHAAPAGCGSRTISSRCSSGRRAASGSSSARSPSSGRCACPRAPRRRTRAGPRRSPPSPRRRRSTRDCCRWPASSATAGRSGRTTSSCPTRGTTCGGGCRGRRRACPRSPETPRRPRRSRRPRCRRRREGGWPIARCPRPRRGVVSRPPSDDGGGLRRAQLALARVAALDLRRRRWGGVGGGDVPVRRDGRAVGPARAGRGGRRGGAAGVRHEPAGGRHHRDGGVAGAPRNRGREHPRRDRHSDGRAGGAGCVREARRQAPGESGGDAADDAAASLALVVEGLTVIAVLSAVVMGTQMPTSVSVLRVTPQAVLIAVVWVVGVWLVGRSRRGLSWTIAGDDSPPRGHAKSKKDEASKGKGHGTGREAAVFAVAALVTLIAGATLEVSGDAIASRIGMTGALFAATVLAASTSLPELSTGLASVRLGDDKLAVSDIFGGNAFLPVLFLPATVLSGKPVLPLADAGDVYLAALGALVTVPYLVGLIFRPKRKWLGAGVDSWAVVVLYALGMAGLFALTRGG